MSWHACQPQVSLLTAEAATAPLVHPPSWDSKKAVGTTSMATQLLINLPPHITAAVSAGVLKGTLWINCCSHLSPSHISTSEHTEQRSRTESARSGTGKYRIKKKKQNRKWTKLKHTGGREKKNTGLASWENIAGGQTPKSCSYGSLWYSAHCSRQPSGN